MREMYGPSRDMVEDSTIKDLYPMTSYQSSPLGASIYGPDKEDP